MRHVLCFAVCLSAPAVALAQFSGFPKPFTATETVSGQTVNIAAQGTMARATSTAGKGYVLSDLKANKAYLVFDESKAYWEQRRTAEEGGDIQDRLDPCGLQKRMSKEVQGLTCSKSGSVTLNGRPADKYVTRMKGADQTITTYFDPELKIVVKQEGGEDGAFEMKNIKVGAAPGPFAVPAGYKKLSDKEYSDLIVKLNGGKAKK